MAIKLQKEAAPILTQPLAERTRFELVVGLLLRQFSKLVVSATHPPLLADGFTLKCGAKLGINLESANLFGEKNLRHIYFFIFSAT